MSWISYIKHSLKVFSSVDQFNVWINQTVVIQTRALAVCLKLSLLSLNYAQHYTPKWLTDETSGRRHLGR